MWSAREPGGTGLRGNLPVPTVEPDPGHAGAGSEEMVGASEQVAVVGGGVIGLSVAWRLAGSGRRVVLVDPAPASGASWLAGGMLAPVTETWPGEEAGLALGLESVKRWPAFADELGSGLLNATGTL